LISLSVIGFVSSSGVGLPLALLIDALKVAVLLLI
jgi:hypothetical protein